MQCLSSIQQPQGLTLVLTGKHKSHLMALIHYSNCFMHKYNHYQQKWGSTIFLKNFKQIVLISHEKSYLSHTFSMVEGQGCSSTIENAQCMEKK